MSEPGLKGAVGSENQSILPSTEPLSPLVPQSEVDALQEECETLRQEATRLRSALETEQAHRQQLEQQCSTERLRAESYYFDRLEYKRRLREAASAYSELKIAYKRVKSPTIHKNNNLSDATTVEAATRIAAMTRVDATEAVKEDKEQQFDDVEMGGSPTQAVPEEEQNRFRVPLLTQAAPVRPEGAIKEDEKNDVVNEQFPLSHSPKYRPAWKKAVRKRRNGELIDDDEEEEEDEDLFLQPQAKKWVPTRRFTASGVVAAKPNQRPNIPRPLSAAGITTTTTTTTRDALPPPQQQQQQQDLPQGGFKHREVIRKKEDREKLQGFECQDCKRFYDAMEKWGAIGVLPQCQHHLNANPAQGGASGSKIGAQQQQGHLNFRNELRAGASRHRYLFEPPLTPNGFWNLGFSPPNKTSSREQEEEEKEQPS
jgi:FtsZ-binding cell division protein ZapB